MQGGDRDFFQTNFVEPGGMTQAAKRILPRGEGGSQENLSGHRAFILRADDVRSPQATRQRSASFLLTRCFLYRNLLADFVRRSAGPRSRRFSPLTHWGV